MGAFACFVLVTFLGAGDPAPTVSDARLQLLLNARTAGGVPALSASARRLNVDLSADGAIDLELHTPLGTPLPIELLRAAGARVVRETEPGTTWIRADVEQAEYLARELPSSMDLRVPTPVSTFGISEGVLLTGAAAAHTLGADGTGTRIAIIDAGFIGLSAQLLSGGLPEPFKKKDYTSSGLEATSNHGTAVALVAHQMAPGAEILLIKIANLAHFKDAVDFAIQKDVDVLCASIGFVGANFSDGTGGAAAAVEKARKKGILPVIAAGNFGASHWIGAFKDKDKDKLLEFAPDTERLMFAADTAEEVAVYLVWDDFPKTDRDLSLVVYYLGTDQSPQGPVPSNLIAQSDVVQNGFQAPIEAVAFAAPASGNYGVFVRRKNNAPKKLALFLSHPINDGNGKSKSSLTTPADAKAALTVGAAPIATWTTGPVLDFSSRGPTTDGRDKPDLVGPSGVQNDIKVVFSGTSSACPHVAGAACVLKSAQPGLSVAELKERLLSYAIAYGAEPFTEGAGRLDIGADYFAPNPNPAALDAGATVLAESSIQLTAVTPSDVSPPLQFRFEYLGKKKQGGNGSDWQSSPSFTDDGLKPDRIYRYRVTVRDSAAFPNHTLPSAELEIRSLAATPPPPKLTKTGASFVKLHLKSGENQPSVELALYSVTHGSYISPDGALAGPTPVYQAAKKWSAVKIEGLQPVTPYEFRVRARNKDAVETALSDPTFVVTLP